jgi:hypothetical protein
MINGLEPSTLVDGGDITVGVPSEAVDVLHEGLAGNPETVADALGVLALLRGFDCGVETVGIFERSMFWKTTRERINRLNRDELWSGSATCIASGCGYLRPTHASLRNEQSCGAMRIRSRPQLISPLPSFRRLP